MTNLLNTYTVEELEDFEIFEKFTLKPAIEFKPAIESTDQNDIELTSILAARQRRIERKDRQLGRKKQRVMKYEGGKIIASDI